MSGPDPGARWRRRRISPELVDVLRAHGGFGTGRTGRTYPRPPLAPQVRGHVEPRILDALERAGWHVHRIGLAVYAHSPDGDPGELHLIFGAWPKRSPRPSWAERLGRVSRAYGRRLERRTREQGWRRLLRDELGRWTGPLPWYRFPELGAYAFEGIRPGWADQELADALEHNRQVRIRRGLIACRPDDFPPYPTSPTSTDGRR